MICGHTHVTYTRYLTKYFSYGDVTPEIDGSDESSYPMTENYTLPIAQAAGCVA